MTSGGPLLDRSGELARLRLAVDAAVGGDGGAVLIEGEAGSGKTSLVRAATQAGRDGGCRVLQATGSSLEQGYPFGIVRQWFDPVLRSLTAEERRGLLAGRAAHALAAIEPTSEPVGSLVAVLDGLHWMMTALTDRGPVLAVVDDAQWADPDSLQVLAYLLPRMASLPVAIVVASRTGELRRTPLASAIASGASRLELGPLSLASVATLVEGVLGPHDSDAFVRACHASTGGNPFLVGALLDELRRTGVTPSDDAAERVGSLGPRAVSSAVVARLAVLPTAVLDVACALCILGDGATKAELSGATGLSAVEVASALDELERAGVVTAEDDPRFVHAITRNAVYTDMGRAARATLHRRAVAILRAGDAPEERIVAHLLATGLPLEDDGVALVRAAAATALGRGAAAAAIDVLRRALPACETDDHRGAVLRDLGVAELLLDGPSAVEHLTAALELTDRPEDRVVVGSALSRALVFADEPEEAATVAVQATEAAEALGDVDLVHRMEALQFAGARLEPRLDVVRKTRLDVFRREGLHSAGPGARALMAAVNYHEARSLDTTAAEAVTRAQWALADGHLAEIDNGGTDFMAAVLVLLAADSPKVCDVLESGMSHARTTGDVFAYAGCSLFLGQALHQRGDLVDAISAAEAGIDASVEYGVAIGLPWGTGILAGIYDAAGDHEAAARTLRLAFHSGDVPDNAIWHAFVFARARSLLSRGHAAEAVQAAIDCGRRFERIDGSNPAMMPWRSLAAEALVVGGSELDRAGELAHEEVALARRWGAPRALGHALRIAASTVPGGDLACLEESVAVLTDANVRLDHAQSLVALGAAIRRRGHRAAARTHLVQGLAIARSCGAVPLAETAAEELAAAGGRPGRVPASGVAALTPSERRVAVLAAEGHTNRAIAQRLFVTQKTVEFHLGQTFRKLAISRRTELHAFFASGGSPDR